MRCGPPIGAWPARDYLAGLVTLPARMQEVQTLRRRGLPLTIARTRWMLGYQRLLVRRCEWLTLMPTDECLPQTSQTAAMGG
jgi:hypothetical protein